MSCFHLYFLSYPSGKSSSRFFCPLVFFPLFDTNHQLGKQGSHNLNGLQTTYFEIRSNPLMQMVLWGPVSIISYKSPTWKTGITPFEWITTNNFRNLHESTDANGFMRSLFHYFTQITPFENGDHIICIDYKQQNSKLSQGRWLLFFWFKSSLVQVVILKYIFD